MSVSDGFSTCSQMSASKQAANAVDVSRRRVDSLIAVIQATLRHDAVADRWHGFGCERHDAVADRWHGFGCEWAQVRLQDVRGRCKTAHSLMLLAACADGSLLGRPTLTCGV